MASHETSRLLQKVLDQGGGLPAAPQVLDRFLQLCSDPKASAGDLAKVLEMDAGLTSRILRLVNSSFYGLAATIQSVRQAIVILGFHEVKSLALSVPVAGFYQKNADKPGLSIATLWQHTLETACLARILARSTGLAVPEDVFVKTILRNIGMVAINNVLGEDYMALVRLTGGRKRFPEVEQDEFGFTHADVGARLAERWRFPQDLIDFIRDHHTPVRDGEVLVEPALVYAARRILQGRAKEESVEELLEDLPPELIQAFGLTPEMMNECLELAQADYDAAQRMLQM